MHKNNFKKYLELGLTNTTHADWSGKTKPRPSKHCGTEQLLPEELLVFSNSVNVMGEKKGSGKWSLS